MNDPKKDLKKCSKQAAKLPGNDEPWGPKPQKNIILLS